MPDGSSQRDTSHSVSSPPCRVMNVVPSPRVPSAGWRYSGAHPGTYSRSPSGVKNLNASCGGAFTRTCPISSRCAMDLATIIDRDGLDPVGRLEAEHDAVKEQLGLEAADDRLGPAEAVLFPLEGEIG